MTVRNLLRQEDAYFHSGNQILKVADLSVSVQVEPPSAQALHVDGNNVDANHVVGCGSNASSLSNESFLMDAMPMHGIKSQESHTEGQRFILGTSPTTRSNNLLLLYQLQRQRSADNVATSGQSLARSPTERFRGSPLSQARKALQPGFLQSYQAVKQAICGGRSSNASAPSVGENISFGLVNDRRHSDVPPASNLKIQLEKAHARDGGETVSNTAGCGPSLPAPDYSLGDVHLGEDAENVRPSVANMDADTDCSCTIPPSDQLISSRDMEELWRFCRELECEQDSKSQQN
jgi:hypothetical protein